MKINKKLDKFTYFDTETTGVNINADKLVSVYCENKNRGWFVNTLTNPEIPIAIEATKVHGIDEELVKNKPTNDKVLAGLVKVFNDTTMICGYNILRFDVPLVINLCNAYNIPINYSNYTYTDVYLMLKVLLTSDEKNKIGSLTLSNMYKYLIGKELADAHDAKADVIGCKNLLNWIFNEYEEDAYIDLLNLNCEYISTQPVSENYKFLTGKREGYTVKELLNVDINYLKWLKSTGNLIFDNKINQLL